MFIGKHRLSLEHFNTNENDEYNTALNSHKSSRLHSLLYIAHSHNNANSAACNIEYKIIIYIQWKLFRKQHWKQRATTYSAAARLQEWL